MGVALHGGGEYVGCWLRQSLHSRSHPPSLPPCLPAPPPQVRQLVLDMVLSTDMDVHFKLLERYAAALAAQPDVRTWSEPEQRSLLFQMLVHLADLANPARPWPLALKWAEMVVTEFLAQVRQGGGG